MSTEVAPANPVTVEEPTTLPSPVVVEETVPSQQMEESSEAPASSATKENPVPSPTPAATKEEHKKRSPFGELKNKFFHKSPSQPTSPTTEAPPAVKETAPAPAVVVEEEAPKENVEAATPAVAPTTSEETPVSEPVVPEEKPEKKEKVKTPLFEKVKSFFGEAKEKKEKKVKTPTEEKAEPSAVPESQEPVSTPAPVESAEPVISEVPSVDVTSPEAVAVAEAKENASAPVPQIVDSGSAVVDPTPEQVDVASESVKPVATEEPTPSAAAETEDGVKFDEAAKTENKPPKKDLVKLGRRLSARLGAVFSSPKKEKTEAEVVPIAAATEASVEPSVPVVSEENKVEPEVVASSSGAEETAVAPKVEESAPAPVEVEEPVKVEESKKEEEVVAPVDAPAEELAAEVSKKEEETPASAPTTSA
ncbi:uncharacterized protein JCM6883_000107 [Sporobolomyces salmoneus]|uniref:uncharacterized protein n=1 Tax=Sporobolomyces salmoneus TaxID=183962 RepID=UPI0031734059